MNDKKPQKIKNWFIQNLFAVGAIIVAIANLWLLNKLSPTFKDIAVLAQRVTNLENSYKNINDKLDQLIFIHVK
jgi:hypothetical protein